MNRSKTLCAECFVQFCVNTTTKNRNKVFVLISRETMKRKWCKDVNVEYKPGKRLFCCEDHLNLEEDLENNQYFKLAKGRPILKSTAKLRLNEIRHCSDNEQAGSSSLKSLLMQPAGTTQSQK